MIVLRFFSYAPTGEMISSLNWILPLFLVGFLKGQAYTSDTSLPENHLHKKLFQSYSPNVVPVPRNKSENLTIYLAVNLQSLVDLNIQRNNIVADLLFYVSWINHQLTWNTSDYDGLESTLVRKKDVWTPTLVLVPELTFLKTDGYVRLNYTGASEFIFSNRITKTCTPNIDDYPIDVHNCSFEFIYLGFSPRVNVTYRRIPYFQRFNGDGAWRVVNVTQKVALEAGVNTFYMEMFFRRHPKYLTQKMVIPMVILSFLPLLTFFIPMESGERVSFAITAMLTMIVSFQYVMDQLPQSNSNPVIVELFKQVLASMVFSVVLSVINVRLFYLSSQSLLRRWIRSSRNCINKNKTTDHLPPKVQSSGNEESNGEAFKNAAVAHIDESTESWQSAVKHWDHFCLFAIFILWIIVFIKLYTKMPMGSL